MERISIDLIPGGYKPTCHASQFDDGRVIRFDLFNRRVPYTLISGESVEIKITKPNGAERTEYIANTQSSYVDWTTVKETCDVAGDYSCELVVSKDGKVIGSGNFTLAVEIDAYGDSTITVKTASGAIATFTTNIVDLLQEVKCEINAKQDLHGYDHPWPAGGGKNKFDDTQATETDFTDNNGTFTNSITDTQTIFRLTLQAYNNYTFVSNLGFATITSIGRKSLTFTFPSDANVLCIKHNGSQQDVVMKYPWTTTGEFTLSLDVLGYNPSVVGGLSFKNVQIEAGSEATPYEPYENICPINGYTEANITRCGVNLFNNMATSQTKDNVVYVVNEDKSITANGTSNGWNGLPLGSVTLPAGTYYLVSDFVGNSNSFYIEMSINGTTVSTYSQNFTLSQTATGTIKLLTPNGTTANDFTCYPAIYKHIDDVYAPYNGNTYTIAFGQTVYGGVLDVTRGKLTVTYGYKDLGSLSWTQASTATSGKYRFGASAEPLPKRTGTATDLPNILCTVYATKTPSQTYNNIDGVTIGNTDSALIYIYDENLCTETPADFKTAMSGKYLAYELATPFDIDLTPVQIEALLGVNNVWHDGNGDTEAKYLYNV